jgi:hypothetical protein
VIKVNGIMILMYKPLCDAKYMAVAVDSHVSHIFLVLQNQKWVHTANGRGG